MGENMEKGERKNIFQNLIIYYFVCSIIGWILEMVYGYMVFGHFVDRGFLYGPMCPIYGCGAVTMVLIAEFMKNKKYENIAVKFIIITVLFTVLEYLTSLILEAIFGLRWWDYTNELLNLNGRVCLVFSLMFGIMGIAFTELVYEPSKRLIEKIREKVSANVIWSVLTILIIIWIIDTVFSVIRYVG